MNEPLLDLAFEARKRAYAPYSGYFVGATVQAEDGRVFTGCNIENVSYGATMCAERVALFSMVAAGERILSRVAVATRDGGTPCGMCLQALLEFSPDPSAVTIVIAGENRVSRTFTLADLLPHGFRSQEVIRTE